MLVYNLKKTKLCVHTHSYIYIYRCGVSAREGAQTSFRKSLSLSLSLSVCLSLSMVTSVRVCLPVSVWMSRSVGHVVPSVVGFSLLPITY